VLPLCIGQLSAITEDAVTSHSPGHHFGSSLGSSLHRKLKAVEQEAARIADESLESIRSYQPEYYKAMGNVINQSFRYAKPFHISEALYLHAASLKHSDKTTEMLNEKLMEKLTKKGKFCNFLAQVQ